MLIVKPLGYHRKYKVTFKGEQLFTIEYQKDTPPIICGIGYYTAVDQLPEQFREQYADAKYWKPEKEPAGFYVDTDVLLGYHPDSSSSVYYGKDREKQQAWKYGYIVWTPEGFRLTDKGKPIADLALEQYRERRNEVRAIETNQKALVESITYPMEYQREYAGYGQVAKFVGVSGEVKVQVYGDVGLRYRSVQLIMNVPDDALYDFYKQVKKAVDEWQAPNTF